MISLLTKTHLEILVDLDNYGTVAMPLESSMIEIPTVKAYKTVS